MPRIVSPASRHSHDSSLVKSSCSIYVRVDRALTFRKSGRSNHSGRYFAAVIRFDDLPRRVVSRKRVLRYGSIVDELVGANAEGNSIARAKVEEKPRVLEGSR